MTYHAIVSYHTNPYTCGVARFNKALAFEISVPLVSVQQYISSTQWNHVLISVKTEEIPARCLVDLFECLDKTKSTYDILLHGVEGSILEHKLCSGAKRVFAANSELAKKLKDIRDDVRSLFAPGAPMILPPTPTDLRFLTLGMAHKIRSEGYRRLAELLSDDGRSYRLEVSTALHEGSSFDEHFFSVSSEISEAFDGNLRFLGFLSDAEVSSRLFEVDAFVAFFPGGVRENNTTVLSAMNHGCAVITNLDSASPDWMRHDVTVFDIGQLRKLPNRLNFRRVGSAAKDSVGCFTFERLADILNSDDQ
jgi:hypothetical protein